MMKRRTGMMKILGMFAMNLAVGLLVAGPVGAQNTRNDLHDGPLIEGFGRHVDLPNADFVMRTDDNIYKVAFEIFQPLNAPERPHMRLEAAARFMNMHAHAGISKENLQVKLVLHGGGPSLPLLEALSNAGVEIFLCEQSRVLNGLDANEVSAPVKSALSAMTAVVTLQADGYQFLTY